MNRQNLSRAFTLGFAAVVGYIGLFAISNTDAEQAVSRRIGFVLVVSSPEGKEVAAFRRGLREAGYEEGRDLEIEWRSANGVYERIPQLMSDLVQRKVEVIVVETTRAAQVAKSATSTIPIVMALVGDPVGSGLTTSLAHPGGNITGLSAMKSDLSAKRLQLLKEAIPQLSRVAVIWNRDTQWHPQVLDELKAVAPSMSIRLTLVSVQNPEELEQAFSEMKRAQAQAIYLIENTLILKHGAAFQRLLTKARLPMVEAERHFADNAGLMSFGPNVADLYLRAAGYVDKILKGGRPGDLPIEQPTKFELVVNLKTAKALGITIPQSILLRADEVIR